MRDDTLKTAILSVLLIALTIILSIFENSVGEYFIAMFISLMLNYVFFVVKQFIFSVIIQNDSDIMQKKIQVIYEYEKITTYKDFSDQRTRVIRKYNKDYFLTVSRFFYFDYQFDIKKYKDFNGLLENEKT